MTKSLKNIQYIHTHITIVMNMMYNKENQLVVYQKSLGAVFQTREPFSGQWTLQRFFQVLIKTCKQISINTAGKRALKLWNLPSSNVIRPKRAKILLHKVAEFYKRLYGGGHELAAFWTYVFVSFKQI